MKTEPTGFRLIKGSRLIVVENKECLSQASLELATSDAIRDLERTKI